jgi:hypothetical protein
VSSFRSSWTTSGSSFWSNMILCFALFQAEGDRRFAPITLGLSLSENYSTIFRKTRFASSALARSGHRAKVHHSITNSKM